MRWLVAALTTVWLVLGWCGRSVISQPVMTNSGSEEQQQLSPSADLWSLLVEPMVDVQGGSGGDGGDEEIHVYQPPAPVYNDLVDHGWLFAQSRTKRQNHHHHSSRSINHSAPMAQLSVSSPIDALRARLKLEMARRAATRQIEKNSDILREIGRRRKRSAPQRTESVDPAVASATVP